MTFTGNNTIFRANMYMHWLIIKPAENVINYYM